MPTADFLDMYDAAKLLAAGNTSYNNSTYFTIYPYQIGFTSFEALLLMIFKYLPFFKFDNNILFTIYNNPHISVN